MKSFKKSSELQKKASRVLVGGVNSPVRSFKVVGGNPVFIKSAKGSKIFDADDNTYIDYIGAYGPMILGHADADVLQAIQETIKMGLSYGSNSVLETKLARLILTAYPFYDKIRFVNSGTEAVMSAIRLARGVSRRSKILKFSGCYHGHMDDLLVAGGSAVATLGLPDSAGITKEAVQNTIVVPYNDIKATEKAFRIYQNEIAAAIVEPVAGNMGLILPQADFLQALSKFCDENRSLLISDEVMCGFRKSYQSVMSSFGVEADITCLGKIIGGGLPVGAYLAKSEIMDNLAPLGEVYQAGTMSGSPVVMAAGITTLQKINSLAFYKDLIRQTSTICNSVRKDGIVINQYGSMFSLFFSDKQPQNFEDVKNIKSDRYAAFFNRIMQKGLFAPPSPFETWFVSAAHSDSDINKTVDILNNNL